MKWPEDWTSLGRAAWHWLPVPEFIRRASRGGLLGEYDFAYRLMLRRDPCVWCGRPPFRGATIEHIQPRSKGGSDNWYNLAGACVWCNRSRGTTSALMWLLLGRRP